MASKFHAVTGRDLDGWHWRSYVGHVQTSKLTGPKAHVIGESYQRGCEFKSLPVQLLSTLTMNLLANTHDWLFNCLDWFGAQDLLPKRFPELNHSGKIYRWSGETSKSNAMSILTAQKHLFGNSSWLRHQQTITRLDQNSMFSSQGLAGPHCQDVETWRSAGTIQAIKTCCKLSSLGWRQLSFFAVVEL